jgi:ribosome recycling factor
MVLIYKNASSNILNNQIIKCLRKKNENYNVSKNNIQSNKNDELSTNKNTNESIKDANNIREYNINKLSKKNSKDKY